ncbi:MAG: transposase [Cyanobacteriota bacterium]|nr:transposase [Cyanobacteriota bacterium]
MINWNYEYRIYPNTEQQEKMLLWLDICKGVFNYALGERKAWIKSRKSPVNSCSLHSEYIIPADEPYPDYYKQKKALTAAKKQYPKLKEVHSQVLQEVIGQVDTAFKFFHQRGFGFPRFKKKLKSFVFPQFKENPIQSNEIKLPKIGKVTINQHRPLPDGFVVKQVRVVNKASGWYLICTIQGEGEIPESVADITKTSMGIDLGFDKVVATSRGEVIDRPRFLLELQSKLTWLQRRLKNKQKGSNNWKKANHAVARLHEHITRKRKDYHYKLAHHLCNQTEMVFVEDINFKAWSREMLKKHSLDFGFGRFVARLEQVCKKRQVYFKKVNKDFTSQTCPNCEAITGKKKLSQRVHSCPECGFTTNRDVAAAMVVEQKGLSVALGQRVVLPTEDGSLKRGAIGNDSASLPRRSRKA